MKYDMKALQIQYLVAFLIIAALSAGCSRNRELLKSFEDVSSGHTRQGQFKISQYRAMSINGQMPFTDIGSAFYYRPGRGNLASVGVLWNDDPDTSYRESYELVQTYTPSAQKEKIQELRDTVLNLTGAVADVVVQIHILETAETKLKEAQEALNKAEKKVEKEEKLRQSAESALREHQLKMTIAEREKALLKEELIQLEQSVQSQRDSLNLLVDTEEKAASQKELDQFVKELGKLEDSLATFEEDNEALKKRLDAFEETVTAASNVVDAAGELKSAALAQFDAHKKVYDDALENLTTAQSESQKHEQNAVRLVKEENLFVFRWNADKSTLGSLKITENLFGNYEKNLGRSGFVIMSGMRSRKLFLSEDDAAKLERNTHAKHYTEYKPLRHLQWLLPYHHGNSLHIVTHIVETHNEAYVSEQSLKKASDVKIDGNAISGSTLKADVLSKATLQAARSALENLANVGTIAAPKVSRRPVLWPWTSPDSLEDYTAYNEAWIPVMAVTTRLSDLDDIFKTKRMNIGSDASMAKNMPSLSGN